MISSTLQIRSPRSPFWRSCAVDVQRDRALAQPAGARDRVDRPDRRRLFEGLADAPRPALLLHVVLQVAARHVQADARSPRCAARHRPRRCRARRGRWPRPVRSRGAGSRSGSGRPSAPVSPSATGSTASAGFRKKNGGSRPVWPISDRMLDVVAADAVDAVHRERTAVGHGHDGLGGRGQHEAHGRSFDGSGGNALHAGAAMMPRAPAG